MALRFKQHLIRNARGSGRKYIVEAECGVVISGEGNWETPDSEYPYDDVGCKACRDARKHLDETHAALRGD